MIDKSSARLFPLYSERQKWKNADGELSSAFLRYGNELISKPIKWQELTREMYCEFSRSGNRSRYEDLYFERRYDLIGLVICECLEGRGRYFGAVLCALGRICDEVSWCLPAHNPDISSSDLGAGSPTVDLFAADTAATLACTLYLLGDELRKTNPAAVERTERELYLRVKKPYIECDFWWTLRDGKKKPCNWSSWISANLFLTFALTERDEGTLKKCMLATSETITKLYDYLPSDGECDEGVAYWNVSPLAVFNYVEIMRSLTGRSVPLPEKLKKFAGYPHSLHISGGKYFNFGDCSLTPALDYPAAYRFAFEAENKAAAGFYRTLVSPSAYIFSGHSTEMTAYRALSALFTRYEGEGKSVPHENVYYEAGKLMSVHVGDYSVSAKGSGADCGHSHIDAGNYIIYKCGEPVAIDAGSARYTRDNFSSARSSLWYIRSSYHNLPSVNGVEQNENDSRAEVIKRGEGLLALDLSGAYRGAKLHKYLRTVSVTKEGVKVRDEMEFTENDNRAEFHIMTAVRPEIDGSVLTVGNAAVYITAPENFTVDIEKIALTDELLRSQWGEAIYRVTVGINTHSGKIGLTLTYL